MVCSGEKTKLLVIGTRQLRQNRLINQNKSLSIVVENKIVTESKSEKLLGLIVNNELTWKDYLYGETWREENNAKGLICQLSQRVGLLSKLSTFLSRSQFQSVSNGIFYSKLNYCIQVVGNVWGYFTYDEEYRNYSSFTMEDCRKLQVLQNRVLRLKTGLDYAYMRLPHLH